jgi:GMP synthase PP-ATPase subunit
MLITLKSLRVQGPCAPPRWCYFRFDRGFLGRATPRIINEVNGINRVVCDVTSKLLDTIKWE